MDEQGGGQSEDVAVLLPTFSLVERPSDCAHDAQPSNAAPMLREVYRAHVDFVWRIVRRLGVPEGAVDDVVHDVFLVVERRLGDYDPSYSMRSWLVGIARRVSKDYFRGRRRSEARLQLVPRHTDMRTPEDEVARTQAAEFVRRFLDALELDQRMVFMLADVEGMSAPEIAVALQVKLPTVYSRLRLARQKFERALSRLRARQERDHGRAR